MLAKLADGIRPMTPYRWCVGCGRRAALLLPDEHHCGRCGGRNLRPGEKGPSMRRSKTNTNIDLSGPYPPIRHWTGD